MVPYVFLTAEKHPHLVELGTMTKIIAPQD